MEHEKEIKAKFKHKVEQITEDQLAALNSAYRIATTEDILASISIKDREYYLIRFIDLKDRITTWEEDTYEGACYLMLTRTNLLIEAGDKGVVELIKVTEDKLSNERHIELLERKRI